MHAENMSPSQRLATVCGVGFLRGLHRWSSQIQTTSTLPALPLPLLLFQASKQLLPHQALHSIPRQVFSQPFCRATQHVAQSPNGDMTLCQPVR